MPKKKRKKKGLLARLFNGTKKPRNPLRKLTERDEAWLVKADHYMTSAGPEERKLYEKTVQRKMYGACNRFDFGKKLREVRAMPIAKAMRPLRNHLLNLAISDVKHATQPYQCRRAGQLIAKARKLARQNPTDAAYKDAVTAAHAYRRPPRRR